jgi:hypothetical protein
VLPVGPPAWIKESANHVDTGPFRDTPPDDVDDAVKISVSVPPLRYTICVMEIDPPSAGVAVKAKSSDMIVVPFNLVLITFV